MGEPNWSKLSLESTVAITLAESDPKQALEVLRIASIYLRHRESLPSDLSNYLSDAFEIASYKASIEDAREALLEELKLKALNKRPTVIPVLELHSLLFNKSDGQNMTTRVKRLAEKLQVSESFIWKQKKRYQREFDEIDRLCEDFSREHFKVYRELQARLEISHKHKG